jgi:pyridoxal phosphate enzyme (YggS family)
MTSIAVNLQAVRARIAASACACGRDPGSIRLLAVSKTWPAGCVGEAVACGQLAFGESYVQEGVDKIAALAAAPAPTSTPAAGELEWHFIGPLQSNKTRLVAENFAWVHSVDRLKIAERLSAQRPAGLPPLSVCVEVNVSGEQSKAGVAPRDALAFARRVAELPRLRLRGLMAIPAPADDPAAQRAPLRELHDLYEQLRRAGLPLDTLSMGMSDDLEAAIAEGATIVRIGSAIFGTRPAPSVS